MYLMALSDFTQVGIHPTVRSMLEHTKKTAGNRSREIIALSP